MVIQPRGRPGRRVISAFLVEVTVILKRLYPSDLGYDDWHTKRYKWIREYFDSRSGGTGRPMRHKPRLLVNAIRFKVASGVPWRLLPNDFPPWESVVYWWGRLNRDGLLEQVLRYLVEDLESSDGHPKRAVESARITWKTIAKAHTEYELDPYSGSDSLSPSSVSRIDIGSAVLPSLDT